MHIVILGNGISGITTARHVRKRDSAAQITVVSGETDYFFSRTALMYIYMGHMRLQDTQPYENWFWQKNRIALKKAWIEKVDFAQKTLHTADGEHITYDKLVLAVGSRSNKFGWPGQDLDGVHGLYHLQDLEAMEKHTRMRNFRMQNAEFGMRNKGALDPTENQEQADSAFRIPHSAFVVGGGLIGIEMAEMFHSRHIPVTFLVREKSFWDLVLPPEESDMINRHIREHGIDLRLETELKEILPDETGKTCAAVVTNKGETLPCFFVGLTVGVSPNIAFLKDSGLETNRGILVNEFLETSVPDVYAIGDCAEQRVARPGRRPIEAVWYTGRLMGQALAQTLTGNRTEYTPGIWFNSAKFFDIEYQTYGDIRAQTPDHHSTLYWEHSDGKKSVRVNYETETGRVVGFNLMGIRYRHAVCERWLEAGTHIESVLQDLSAANFDPEFYKSYESEIIAEYNRQSGKNLQLRHTRGLSSVFKLFSKQHTY